MAAKRKATKKASQAKKPRAKKSVPPRAVEVLEEAAYAIPRVRPGFIDRILDWLTGKA